MSDNPLSSFSREVASVLPQILRETFKQQGDALGRGTITVPQYLCLYLLDTQGLLKMKDVARQLNTSLPAATGLVERLFRAGMLRRVYDKKDRRVIYIELLPKGKTTIRQVQLERQKLIGKIFGNLTEKERNDYLHILRKIKGVLDNQKNEV